MRPHKANSRNRPVARRRASGTGGIARFAGRHLIRLRLRSDVPVGAFLSGGVDSSTIVALASLQLDRPLQTFSVGFAEQDYSELAWARRVAAQYRTDHHERVVSAEDVEAVLDALLWHFDEPFGDYSYLPTYYLCREARQSRRRSVRAVRRRGFPPP